VLALYCGMFFANSECQSTRKVASPCRLRVRAGRTAPQRTREEHEKKGQ
jgi:hypothetical protein